MVFHKKYQAELSLTFMFQFFFNCPHTFSNLCLFIQNFAHKSKNCTQKMQNASHLLQNKALHSKYHKHISKANIILQTPLP